MSTITRLAVSARVPSALRNTAITAGSAPAFSHHRVALAFCGYVPENLGGTIAERLPAHRLPVAQYAARVCDLVMQEVITSAQAKVTPNFNLTGLVAGYDEDTVARVFAVHAPDAPEPVEQHPGRLGITWGGMREVVDRLLQGYDSQFLPRGALAGIAADTALVEVMNLHMWIPLDTLPLAECAELATFLIQTTIDVQRFQIGGQRGVGGPIDALTITSSDGARFVRRKAMPPPADDLDAWQWRAVHPSQLEVTVDTPADIRRVSTYSV